LEREQPGNGTTFSASGSRSNLFEVAMQLGIIGFRNNITHYSHWDFRIDREVH
jgi:hypothetical protein